MSLLTIIIYLTGVIFSYCVFRFDRRREIRNQSIKYTWGDVLSNLCVSLLSSWLLGIILAIILLINHLRVDKRQPPKWL